MNVKLVDIDSREWIPYAPLTVGKFGENVKCQNDAVCLDYMAAFGIDRRLEKGKRPMPLDVRLLFFSFLFQYIFNT